jgi:hypothetical protein
MRKKELILDLFHSALLFEKILTMPRDNIPQSATKKLQQFFTKTLGKDL